MTFHTILGRINPYVNVFDCATNHLVTNLTKEVHICITAGRTLGNGDVRCYNVPTINKVAMIIYGKPGKVGNHNVIVQQRYGSGLQWMNELAPS
jgi:hypothetical protein